MRDHSETAGERRVEVETDAVWRAVEAAPLGFGLLNQDLRYRWVNSALAEINGRSVEAHLGRTVREVLPYLAETLEPRLRQVLASGQPLVDLPISGETAAAPGVVRQWLATYYRVPAEAGTALGIGIVVQEVTIRPAAEATRVRQGALLDQAHDAVLVWSFGGPGRAGPITYWNPAASALYGYAASEAIGQVSHELLHTEHPGGTTAFEAELERRGHWRGELVHTARDGRRITVDTALRLIAAEGGGYEVLETSRDITDRKAVEETLRRRAVEFRTLVEHAPDMILRLGADLRILYANAAVEQSLGRHAPEIIGRMAEELGVPEPQARAWAVTVRQVLRTGREHWLDLALPTPAGERLFQARLAPEVNGGPAVPPTVLAILRDVTELRRAEEARDALYRELLENQRRVQDLAERALLGRADADRRAAEAEVARLTPRERQVLGLLTEGLTNAEIGDRLGLSAGTVKNYLARLLPKIGASDRVQGAIRAVALGLVADRSPE